MEKRHLSARDNLFSYIPTEDKVVVLNINCLETVFRPPFENLSLRMENVYLRTHICEQLSLELEGF